LSYNNPKKAQNNAIVVQQEEMDRVGVEPTTSDHKELSSISIKLQGLLRLKEREKHEGSNTA